MTKYIDADKIRAKIKHLKSEVYDEAHQFDLGARCSLAYLEDFIDSLQQEQPAETDEVKWRIDGDYDDTDQGRFVLGSVGVGFNGYYIPYSDLLKLPKEESK